MTLEEIKAIQKNGIDWFGWPLKVDGVLGAKTNWWMGVTSLSPQRQNLIRIALGYHATGMKEDPGIENGGTFVDMLLKPAGLKNAPWCIAFISHCYKEAGLSLPKYFTSAWGILDWAAKNGKLIDSPLPGDIVAYTYPKKPGDTQIKGHGEIVLAFDGQWTYDVGGNVTNAVRAGKRSVKPDMKYIRVLDDQHGPLSVPINMMRLDNLGDR